MLPGRAVGGNGALPKASELLDPGRTAPFNGDLPRAPPPSGELPRESVSEKLTDRFIPALGLPGGSVITPLGVLLPLRESIVFGRVLGEPTGVMLGDVPALLPDS